MKAVSTLTALWLFLPGTALAADPWRQIATHATMLAMVLSVNLIFFFLLFLVSAISNKRKRSALSTLTEQAYLDPLTKVLNRRGFERRLTHLQEQSGFLIVADIDDFKAINDSYGHDAGDRILSAVASRLRQALRPEDIVSRFGGEEFVVFCKTPHLEEASRLGNRLVQAIAERPFVLPEQGQQVTITISAGASKLSDTPSAYLGAYRNADKLLYKAKSSGKNQLVVHN
ncbi:GGDEF domain-containing protein [Alteromonas sp. H39]|uniref:GGDEF domain-containing protein n=1 Tax=Alteromonas sp. H39 TaxID=3389876 RepID=UPI0039DFF834